MHLLPHQDTKKHEIYGCFGMPAQSAEFAFLEKQTNQVIKLQQFGTQTPKKVRWTIPFHQSCEEGAKPSAKRCNTQKRIIQTPPEQRQFVTRNVTCLPTFGYLRQESCEQSDIRFGLQTICFMSQAAAF